MHICDICYWESIYLVLPLPVYSRCNNDIIILVQGISQAHFPGAFFKAFINDDPKYYRKYMFLFSYWSHHVCVRPGSFSLPFIYFQKHFALGFLCLSISTVLFLNQYSPIVYSPIDSLSIGRKLHILTIIKHCLLACSLSFSLLHSW